MAPNCQVIVHEDCFRKCVSEASFNRYKEFLYRSYVDDNPNVKGCPAPGCEYAVRSDRRNRMDPIVCVCGFRYWYASFFLAPFNMAKRSFACSDYEVGDHTPATCEQVEMWRRKASDESENVKWMQANTKRCPSCRSPIEKNGGCMHMTCHGCKHEFCWLCRGPWSEHGSATGGFYNCNKYDASNAKEEDIKAEESKTELEYYMFYYHRFSSHKSALVWR